MVQSLHDQVTRHIATANSLYDSGHYDWALFMWHLALEKTLKARMITQNKDRLYIHDLLRLATAADLDLTPDEIDELTEINSFNIEARYDDFKTAFYLKATKQYADQWKSISMKLYKKFLLSV